MDVELVATVGSLSSNSYLTAAETGDVLSLVAASSRCKAWNALATADKELFLMRATRLLEQFMEWDGRKVMDDQPIGWPRDFVYGPDRCLYLPNNVIPTQVKEAQALMALHLSEGFEADDQAASPVDYIKVSSIAVSFASERAARSSMLLPPEVVEKLRGFGEYIGASGRGRAVSLVRG